MKFQVNWQLEHNGKAYQAGETIDLDQKKDKATVEQLTASGVISATTKAEKTDKSDTADKSDTTDTVDKTDEAQ